MYVSRVFLFGRADAIEVGFDNIRRTRSCCACQLGNSHSTITTAAPAATPRALASRMIKTISQLGITHTEKGYLDFCIIPFKRLKNVQKAAHCVPIFYAIL